jgi:mRNA interferase HigB
MAVKLVGRDRLITGEKQLDKALAAWARVVETVVWKHFPDVRGTWRRTDLLGEYTVFDIRDNRYRLITRVSYKMATVVVEAVLPHARYDRWSRKQL